MCCKLFLQRKSKNQSMCRFPGPLLGVLDQRERPSLSGQLHFLIWHGQWFVLHAGPDDAPRMEIVSKDRPADKLMPMACARFRRHRVRCFDGAGGGSWRDG